MPQKSKFSPEEKEAIVQSYLNGKKALACILEESGIYKSTLQRWVILYENEGILGLTPTAQNKHYPAEIKMQAVREYLDGKASYMDLMRKYKVSNKAIVQKWVKQYNSHGDFQNRRTGSEIYMAKGRKTSFEERQEIVAYCLAHGTNYRAAAEAYNVSYQQVFNWVKKYNSMGTEGLEDRRGKAKPEERMTEEDRLRAKVRMLEAQLYQKEMENDVIKKLIEVKGRWS